MSFNAAATTYLANRRLAPADYRTLLALVYDRHALGRAAQQLYAPADVENGPTAESAAREEHAGDIAEDARKNLALALLARDVTLGSDDLDLVIFAVEEMEHRDGCHHKTLMDALHSLANEAFRREHVDDGREDFHADC